MTNNYNAVARFYDFLSYLIFKHAIIDAQVFLLKQIPAASNVLIIGGGTGRLLEALAKMQPENINITYVEKSAKMIDLSKKRNYKKLTVEFINKAAEDFITNKKFDIVFTAFFFDNFQTDKIEFIFSKLNQSLKPDGLWLYADFIDNKHNKLWQKLLLKTMYIFFKLTCNIDTTKLIQMDSFFEPYYTKTAEVLFYKNFIRSAIYRKNTITV